VPSKGAWLQRGLWISTLAGMFVGAFLGANWGREKLTGRGGEVRPAVPAEPSGEAVEVRGAGAGGSEEEASGGGTGGRVEERVDVPVASPSPPVKGAAEARGVARASRPAASAPMGTATAAATATATGPSGGRDVTAAEATGRGGVEALFERDVPISPWGEDAVKPRPREGEKPAEVRRGGLPASGL
jgi:hypothetical protein